MKFRVRTKGLSDALDPALNVAAAAGIKDYESGNRITLIAEDDGIVCLADNGFAQLKGEVSNNDYANLDYEGDDGGVATVRVKELKEVLASFADNDTIEVELTSDGDSGGELRFSNAADKDVFQSLSVFSENIGFPKIVVDQLEAATNIFKVRRDIFSIATNRLAFARGFEEFRPEYKYWVIRASQDRLRFACGSGARFAIIDYEGSNISNATEDVNVFVPGDQSGIITKLTTKVADETIDMVTLDAHLAIRTRNFLLSMPNYDPTIKWPDENKVLDRKNQYRMVTRLGDWPSIVRGIMATNNDEFKQTNQYHIAQFTISPSSNEIIVEAHGNTMRARRKARISDLEGEMEDGHKLRIESMYVQEAFKSASEDDYAQWEFNDEGVLVIRFYASPDVSDPSEFVRVNEATGLKERFSMLVATLGEDV
tara:strand:- start:1999 stop:3276 length:1278 start_codon:yes stop_codon:yes gene_type:complete